jgi:hypothetical protein
VNISTPSIVAANVLSLAYLLSRVVYTIIYVVLQDETRDGDSGNNDEDDEDDEDDDATVTPNTAVEVTGAAEQKAAGKAGEKDKEAAMEEGRGSGEEAGGKRSRSRRRRRGTLLCALPRSRCWALARSATWFSGIGVIFAMFMLAGVAMVDA